MSNLPDSWLITNLADVAKWGSGGTPSRANPNYYGGNIPWIKTGELGKRIVLDSEEKITNLGLQNSSAKLFPKGSVAIAMYGATIGKTSILGIDSTTNQACAVGTPIESLTTSEYLYHFLSSQKEAFIKAGKGGAQPNISQTVIKDWPVPIAPLNEQKRIADKLDAVLARVDACRDRLDRIPTILKRFRQSVLAAATSGALTEDWREELSKQFLWESRTVSDIAQVIDPHPSHRTPPEIEDGVPYISIGDINSNGEIDFDGARKVSHDVLKEHQARYRINSGDFIFGKIGTIDKPTKLPTDRVYTISANVLLIQTDNDFVTGEYLRIIFSSPAFMATVTENSAATSQSAFGIKKMRDARVQLPDIAEQAEIVRRVESLFAYADRLEARYINARGQVEKLTPSLLAKAFRGELVPQDPNDESASELLARIAAARSTDKPVKARQSSRCRTAVVSQETTGE